MENLSNILKTLVIIVNKRQGFLSINNSAKKVLGWSLDDLNKFFPYLTKLSANLADLETLILDLNTGSLNKKLEEISSYRKEVLISGYNFNCYIHKSVDDFVLEFTPIVYQDLSQITHEFKRPIQNIKTLIEVLIIGAKNDAQKLDEYLNKLNHEADRLATLVNDMLSFSRLDYVLNNIEKIDFNLFDLVEELFFTMDNVAKQKNISLRNLLDPSFVITGDRKIIEHAIANLFDNAIKYNVNNGYVSIYASDSGFVIEDSGLGMTKEDSKKVFDQFYRIADRLHIQGSGLGLNLVKKIITLHGWSISIESEINKGSKFKISF